MKFITSNWGKASSSRNTKAKALHTHHFMLTEGEDYSLIEKYGVNQAYNIVL
jgi:hypothetical protein